MYVCVTVSVCVLSECVFMFLVYMCFYVCISAFVCVCARACATQCLKISRVQILEKALCLFYAKVS